MNGARRAPCGDRARRSREAAPLLTALALGALLALVPWPAPWVEPAFSRGLFPVTSHLLAPVVGAVPFSLTFATLAALAAAALSTLATARGRSRFRCRLLRYWLPWSLAGALLGFMLVWGLAYRRSSLAALLGVPITAPTVAQVELAQQRLLAALYASADSAPPGPEDVSAAARCVAAEVQRVTGVRVAVPGRVKPLPAGSLLRAGFAGVTSPWLLEPHVDAGLPPVAMLATATHELTHAAGFAVEADTDALAVLAGLRCSDPAVRYALALHALEGLAGGMPRGAATRLTEVLPQRARGDLRAEAAASERYRLPWLQRAASAAYGTYLKGRGVSAGMADYDRATSLVVQALAHGLR